MKYKDTVEKLAREYHLEEKIRDLLPIFESFDNRNELFAILNGDAKTANNAARLQPADQYLRRTVIRTTFAMIEGLLNILNQTVLDYYKGGFAQLTPKEIEDLTEEKNKKNGGDYYPVHQPSSLGGTTMGHRRQHEGGQQGT